MSTSYFKVFRGEEFLGWTSYSNSADVWTGMLAPTIDDLRAGLGRKERDCTGYDTPLRARMRDPHELVTVQVNEEIGGDDRCELRFCPECRTLVTPPFDGYAYHDYGCAMQPCTCDDG